MLYLLYYKGLAYPAFSTRIVAPGPAAVPAFHRRLTFPAL